MLWNCTLFGKSYSLLLLYFIVHRLRVQLQSMVWLELTFLCIYYSILKCVESYATSTNKNVRLALCTVVLNTSSYAKTVGRYDDSIPELFLIIIGNICGSALYETEATVRVLTAFGTALLTNDAFMQKAKALNMGSMLQHVASQHGEKAAGVASEIQSILQ